MCSVSPATLDAGRDRDIAKPVAGVFEHRAAPIAAVGNIGDKPPHLSLGQIEQFGHTGLDRGLAVLVQQIQQIALTNGDGGQLRPHIPDLQTPRAHIGQQQIDHVAALLAPVADFEGRNPQALGIDLGRVRVIAGRDRAADIGHMALADRPEDQLVAIKDRLVHAAVNDVRAVPGRVVVVEHIAGVDLAGKVVGHRAHGRHQRTEVDGDILTLQNHLGLAVEQGVGIVAGDIEDRRARGFLDRQRHLALGRFQHALNHRQGNRINVGCHTSSAQVKGQMSKGKAQKVLPTSRVFGNGKPF